MFLPNHSKEEGFVYFLSLRANGRWGFGRKTCEGKERKNGKVRKGWKDCHGGGIAPFNKEGRQEKTKKRTCPETLKKNERKDGRANQIKFTALGKGDEGRGEATR